MFVTVVRNNASNPWRFLGAFDSEPAAREYLKLRLAYYRRSGTVPHAEGQIVEAPAVSLSGSGCIESLEGQELTRKYTAVKTTPQFSDNEPDEGYIAPARATKTRPDPKPVAVQGEKKSRGRQPGSKRCPSCNRVRVLDERGVCDAC